MLLVGWLAAAALAAWLTLLLLPSRPWGTRERLEPSVHAGDSASLGCVSVLIPARDEAESIATTLTALTRQGADLDVVLVDDQSGDGTAGVARAAVAVGAESLRLRVIDGQPLADGWGGKLWALEQGLAVVDREYCLLLDAEIALAPGVIAMLLDKARTEQRAMVSIMARLRSATFWEKFLVPPFIFFFKLIYPFAAVNESGRRTAAAAGGCTLIRTAVLRDAGGFSSMRDALIDDCTLAARIKRNGHSIWLGLSSAVISLRAYPTLASFRRMVTRTAFTQLGYSSLLLTLVCLLMLVVFVAPWAAIVGGPNLTVRGIGVIAVGAMAAAYWPTVHFHGLRALWTLTLPLAALLYLAMTFESALNYWRGTRATWKGRRYAAR